MGLDGEMFSLSLQRKLIEGDVILKTNRLAINRDLSDG
jgi:hypothetical protein